jgi:hypothetical protein
VLVVVLEILAAFGVDCPDDVRSLEGSGLLIPWNQRETIF